MFKIILSALASFAQFLFRGIIVKFFVFFGLFYITTEFVPLVIEMFIPASLVPDINALFNQVPDSMWYFLNLMEFPLGVSLVVTSWVSRFIIRRLPIIG